MPSCSPPVSRRRWLLRAPAAFLVAATIGAVPTVATAAPLTLIDKTAPLGPGITLHHKKTLDTGGWLDRQVVTVDLSNAAVSSDLLAAPKVSKTNTSISTLARNAGAVAGVNGDFFDINDTGAGTGAEVKDGRLIKSADATAWNQVGVGKDGIGRLVDMTVEASATFGGTAHPVLTFNTANVYGNVGPDSLIAYTPDWGEGRRQTGIKGHTDIAEVIVSAGKVVSVNATGSDSSVPVPADGFVLLGAGTSATALRALAPGDDVSFTYGLKDDVAKDLKFGIGGNRVLVKDGQIQEGSLDPDSDKHPRTAIGFKDGGKTMLLITWNGRQSNVPGASMRQEAEAFMELGAEIGVNLDGGGSSTLVSRDLGSTDLAVRNTPSDGGERPVPDGVGVFVAPGSGLVDGLVITPEADAAKVFPGLHRTLTAKAIDDHQTPVALGRGEVRWSTDAGTIDNGQLVAPTTGGTTVTVRGRTDGADASRKVQVLGKLKSVELSTGRLSFADTNASSATTVRVTGRDAQGYTAPIELADLDLTYDEKVVKIAPAGNALRVTPLTNGGTVLKLRTAGITKELAITAGVQTVKPYNFDDEGVAGRWSNNGSTGVITKDPEGLRLDFPVARNKGISAQSIPARWVPIPGQPLKVRIKVKSNVFVPSGLTYAGFWDATMKSHGLYGTGLEAKDGWQYVTFTIPSTVTYPIIWNSFQGINTAASQQQAGTFIFGGVEADVPSSIELPAQEPLASDPLISADGTTNGEDDWNFATLSDIQFTETDPTLTKVGIAALQRIRKQDPDLIVLNGDITDRGLAGDITLARQTLEAGGCDLIAVGAEPPAESTPDPSSGKVPCYYVPGNHESYGVGNIQSTLDPFKAEFGRPYRTFDHKGTRFILLNSALGGLRNSDPAQLAMFQEALDTAKADAAVSNVMVFAHHPVDDPAETKSSQLTERDEVALIKKLLSDFRTTTDKGVAMVGSHAQITNVNRIEGVPYIVLPSSGKAPYGTPDRGGITGWLNWSVDRDAKASGQWITADVRAFAQSITLNAPASVEVSTKTTLSGSLVQPSGVENGSRVVPLAYPVSVRWSGSETLAIGSGAAAVDAARAAGKAAILDPATRELTGLKTGQITVKVTAESMREYTDDASLAPVTTEQTIEVAAFSGPGPRITAPGPVFPAQSVATIGAGQPVTITNAGDEPLEISGVAVKAKAGSPEGEFLLADDACKARQIAPGASCIVLVRFAPSRADVTSEASLVITGNVADRTIDVPLSGLSTTLLRGDKGDDGEQGAPGQSGPAGPKGETGQTGPKGESGDVGGTGPKGDTGAAGAAGPTGNTGATGSTGAKGDTGATGANGTNGAKGDTGATGANGTNGAKGDTGATGAKGDTGATGPKGANGRNATVKCTVKRAKGTQKVTCVVTTKGSATTKASTKAAAKAKATLTRSGRTYARGTVGSLKATRTLTRGSYTLRVQVSKKQTDTFKVAVR